jgi:hypothetical protein
LPPLAPVPPAPVGSELWGCTLSLPFLGAPEAVAFLTDARCDPSARPLSGIYHPPRSVLAHGLA